MQLGANIKEFFFPLFFLILFYQSFSQSITSISPNNALQGQWLNVTISGQNTNFTTGSPTGWLSKPGQNNIFVSPKTIISDTQYSSFVQIPLTTDTGLWDVNVNDTTIGTMTLANGFTILSQNYTPPAPVLLSPSDGSTLSACNTTFNWNASNFANSYQIIVDNDPAFLPPNILNTTTYSNNYSQQLTLPGGTIYWKVRGYITYNNFSNWSQTFSFTVNSNPVLVSINPDSAQIGQTLSVIISGSCTNFTQGSPTSWLSKGSSIINLDTLNAYQFQDTLLYSTFTILSGTDTGWWDVNYVANLFYDTLSLPNSFLIKPSDPPPVAPILLSPTDGSTISICTPVFNWSPPQYAYTYELLVADDSSFANPIIQQNNLSFNTFYSALIFDNGTHYWKVRAKNIANLWGNWSTTFSFTINTSPSLVSTSPNNAIQGQTLDVYISGACTHFMQGSPTSWISKGAEIVQATNITKYSDTLLVAKYSIPWGSPLCLLDFNVYSPGDNDTIVLADSFTISGSNYISGKVFYDINNNCQQDNNEIPISSALIKSEPGPKYATSDNTGFYSFSDTGNFTISQIIQNPLWLQSCPGGNGTYSVTSNTCSSSNINHFADTLSVYCPILEVDISTALLRRCFSNNTFAVKYCNQGNATENNVSVELTFDSKITPVTSTIPWTLSGGVYSFNVGPMQPYTCGTFYVTTNVSCSASLGDTLCANAAILPGITCGGVDTMGFQTNYNYCRIVSGSWDPNEKILISPMTNNYIHPAAELEYQINFQNTGTDTAFRIVVTDTLSSYLDVATVVSGVSSHPYTFKISGQGILEWTFENILLADSFVNEPASHGFVKFKVKQKSGNPEGSIITNNAAIYFDFNSAVITNTVQNTVSTVIIVPVFRPSFVNVYPNPFSNGTTFTFINKTENENYEIGLYDVIGKKVTLIQNIISDKYYLENKNLPSGVYFYKVSSASRAIAFGKLVVY